MGPAHRGHAPVARGGRLMRGSRGFSPVGLWRRMTRGLATLLRRDAADRDLDDEVRHFLDEAVAELVASGVSPAEARRRVYQRWGDGLAEREQVRAYGWDGVLELLGSDVRLAVRRLIRTPGFTVVAVLTLGLGIGAATAIFSAASPVLFRALPYPDPSRVVAVAPRGEDGVGRPAAFGTYLELAERTRGEGVFEALAAVRPWTVTHTGAGEPQRLQGQRVGAAYFDVLGVAPAFGPGFDAAEDRPGGAPTVILSYRLWNRLFAGHRAALDDATLRLDGATYRVVGVLPADFEDVLAPTAEIYTLLQYDPAPAAFETREWGNHLALVGRVSSEGSLPRARTALNAVAAEPVAAFPRPAWASLAQGVEVRPLGEVVTAEARPLMVALLTGVALLLGVTCANVSLLLLARTARRRPELAMRVALGAARDRVLRTLLSESLVLAALGGLVGLGAARVGIETLVALAPPAMPRLDAVALDGVVLAFAFGLTTAIGLLAGLLPVLWPSGGGSLLGTLRDTGRGSVGGGSRARGVLVGVEVALAVVLLVGAGLLLRTTQHLFRTSPGFDTRDAVVLHLPASGKGGGVPDTEVDAYFDRVLEAARGVPGVQAAALTSQLPLSGDADVYGVRPAEADAERADEVQGSTFRYAVSPGYFEVMGIPLLQGRALEPGDHEGSQAVAVLGQALARRMFGSGDPVGRRIRVGAQDTEPFTVVGVVADVKQASLDAAVPNAVYLAARQWHWADASRWLVVRAGGEQVAALVPPLRQAVWSVDANQPVVRTQTLRDLVAASEVRRRFTLLVLSTFALAALLLAGVGLYGVLAGAVTERTRELGVRVALGASHDRIVALVLRRGMTLVIAGLLGGLTASLGAGRVLASLLYGISPLDGVTYAGVAALLALVGGLACWLPARRAARVDPLEAMRAE